MPTYARLALVHVTAPLAVANLFCGSTVTELTTRLLTLTPPLALAAGAQSVVASRTHTSAQHQREEHDEVSRPPLRNRICFLFPDLSGFGITANPSAFSNRLFLFVHPSFRGAQRFPASPA